MAEENNVVINFVGNNTSAIEASKQVEAQVIKTAKVSTEAMNEFNKANQNATKSTEGLEAQLRDLTKIIGEGVIKEYAKDIQDAAVKHVTLRTQVQQSKQALYELAEQGKKGTKEWNEAWTAAEKYSTALKEINKTVATLGNQTKVFSGLIDAARGVAAGFEVAKGASLLFGASTEETEKIIKQLVPLMATLQGLQELQLLTTEESAAMQLVLNGQRLAGVAAINLETAAQSENIIVSKAATAAQWALNAAMEANPIMLLVGAIGAVVAAFLYFTKGADEAAEAQKELNKELEEYNKLEEKRVETQRENSKLELEVYYKNKIANAKNETEATKLQIEYEEKLIQQIGKKVKALKQAEEAAKAGGGEENPYYVALHNSVLKAEKEQAESAERIKKLHEKLDKDDSEALNKKDEEYRKHLREMQKAEEEALKERLLVYDRVSKQLDEELIKAGDNTSLTKDQRIQYYYLGGLTKEEIAKRLSDILSEAEKEAMGIESSRIKNQQEQNDAFANWRHDKAVKEGEQRLAEEKKVGNQILSFSKDITNQIFSYESQMRQEQLSAQLKALNEKKSAELNNKNLTEAQKAAIERRYAIEEARLKRRTWESEQQAKVAQAVINGALAITTLAASTPPTIGVAPNPSYYAGLALLAATTAVQVGLIESAKPPAFAKGTEYVERNGAPAGTDTIHAMVNEGERIVPTEINKKLAGIKNEDLPALVQAAYYPPMPNAPEFSQMNVVVQQPAIDYKLLAKAFAEELRANPQTHLHLDKNGFAINIVEKGRSIERLNNRYDSK